MDSALADELRALRARAYGRDADLDHAAAARLRELEAMRVRARADAAADLRSGDADPHESADPDAGARAALLDALESLDPGASLARRDIARRAADEEKDADGETTEARGGSAADRTQRRLGASRTRRRRTALWIASLVATAAIASLATWGIAAISPVTTSSGSLQVATLEPVSDENRPTNLPGIEGDSPIWLFHGIVLFTNDGGSASGESGQCLWAYVPDGGSAAEGTGGIGSGRCGVGRFPASVTLPVDDQIPALLRESFPDATAVQFVLDGDRVRVFLDEG